METKREIASIRKDRTESRREALFGFLEHLHTTACIGVRIERILETQTTAYLEGTTPLIFGHYFEDIEALEREILQIPDITRQKIVRAAIQEYGKRLFDTAYVLAQYKKQHPQMTAEANASALGPRLFKNILNTEKGAVGKIYGAIKNGYIQLICTHDDDYARLRHGRIDKKNENDPVPGTTSAGVHIVNSSLDLGETKISNVPLIVLHQGRCGTSIHDIIRHELQHFIHHQTLQLFAVTELRQREEARLPGETEVDFDNRSQETKKLREQLRSIKDEILAYTREGRDPASIRESLEDKIYEHLFNAIPGTKKRWAHRVKDAVINAIGASVPIQDLKPYGRLVLVNLLYGIPLERMVSWMPIINDFYRARIVRTQEYFFVQDTYDNAHDPYLLDTLDEPGVYVPVRHRHLLKEYRAVRLSFNETAAALEPLFKDLPHPLPSFEAIPVELLDLEQPLEITPLASPLLERTNEKEFRRLATDLASTRENLDRIAKRFKAGQRDLGILFVRDIQVASTNPISKEQHEMATSLVPISLRPAVKELKKLIDQLAPHEQALATLRDGLTNSRPFREAIVSGERVDGKRPYAELDYHAGKLAEIRAAISAVWGKLLRDRIPPVHLMTLAPAYRDAPLETKKKGPNPFDAVKEDLLRVAVSYQRDTTKMNKLRASTPLGAAVRFFVFPDRGTIQEELALALVKTVREASRGAMNASISALHKEKDNIVCVIQIRDPKSNRVTEELKIVLPLAPEMTRKD